MPTLDLKVTYLRPPSPEARQREGAVVRRVHGALVEMSGGDPNKRPALREMVMTDLLCVPGDAEMPGALFLMRGPRGLVSVTHLSPQRLRDIHTILGSLVAALEPDANNGPSA